MTKHVSIRVRRLSKISDMAKEQNQSPTADQRRDAADFRVTNKATKRSQDRGLTVRRLPQA